MKTIKRLTMLVLMAVVASLCIMVVSASGQTQTGSATIGFYRPIPEKNTGSGGSNQQDRDRDRDRSGSGSAGRIPDSSGMVSIIDARESLSALPKTGGDTAIPTLLILLGAGCLLAIPRGGQGKLFL